MKNDFFKNLDKLTEEGFLRRVISPCKNLVLYNYTDKCTYERMWNNYTLNARGTIYEIETGNIVGKAFPKFFNFCELSINDQNEILELKKYECVDKLDGSLGIIYYYNNCWNVNTRGSFTSDQSIKGTELLSKYRTDLMDKNKTYMCEIIYPENKIIVNYGEEEKLVLLGVIDTKTGVEVDFNGLFLSGLITGMEIATSHNYTIEEIINLQKTIDKDCEGFVVKYKNNKRVKFKGEDYLRIARILKDCGPLALWEKMSNGVIDRKFIESIPEEILPEVQVIIDHLEFQYNHIKLLIDNSCNMIVDRFGDNRKEIGLYLKENNNIYNTPIFNFLDNKHNKINNHIIKLIRPTGNVLNNTGE